MALKRVGIPSPNQSSRGGSKVRLIVLHTSEGATTYQSLGNFFSNPSSGVSSHTGIDNSSSGVIGEYVGRSNKAWTSCNANPVAVQAELCTPSGAAMGWSAATWQGQSVMLANAAAWIAEESAALGIPIVRLSPSQAQGGSAGVCQHSDLGGWGCGHSDCGPNFPMDQVISMAKGGAPTPTPPTPTPTPPPAGKAPPFPLPSGYYYGPASGPTQSVSGQYPPYGGPNGAAGLKQWQGQMAARGWTISADGFYGNQTAGVARQFQQEKGLSVDGLIGISTWNTAWTAPVT